MNTTYYLRKIKNIINISGGKMNNKLKLFTTILSISIVLSACNNVGNKDNNINNNTNENTKTEDRVGNKMENNTGIADIGLKADIVSEIEGNLINNEIHPMDTLGYRWAKEAFKDNGIDNNLAISPLGISRTLSMLANGMDTEDNMLSYYKNFSLLDKKYKNTNSESIILANKTLTTLSKEGKNNKYIKSVEFPEEATKEKLNLQKRVLGEALNSDKFKEDLVLALLDATKFKSDWEDPFDPENTTKEDFTLANGDKKEIDMMVENEGRQALITKDVEMTSKRGKNGSIVYFIKPKSKDIASEYGKISEYMKEFNRDSLNYNVNLYVPKVEFKSKIENLGKYLNSLGLDAISETFDLPNYITKTVNPLFIGSFSQDTYFKLDEKGTEAKSYTEMGVEMTSLPIGETKEVDIKMNSPYFIVVEDKSIFKEKDARDSNNIVFIAYVADPTK